MPFGTPPYGIQRRGPRRRDPALCSAITRISADRFGRPKATSLKELSICSPPPKGGSERGGSDRGATSKSISSRRFQVVAFKLFERGLFLRSPLSDPPFGDADRANYPNNARAAPISEGGGLGGLSSYRGYLVSGTCPETVKFDVLLLCVVGLPLFHFRRKLFRNSPTC